MDPALDAIKLALLGGVQELKPSSPARFLLVVEAGGRSPGRSLDLTTQRLTDA